MLNLKDKYIKEVVPQMKEKFGYKNNMAVPKLLKVAVNTGFGRMVVDKTSGERTKIQETIMKDLSLICGQSLVLTKARKSISVFKLREGVPIGAMVVLRRKKMYDFLDRLIHIAIPRFRDFRGIEQKSIDKQGNFTIAVKEHIAFPEIAPEKTRFIFGFEITIVNSAKTKEQALELFRLLGFPIKK